jgi:aminoglycoside phosphotransferase (APT) family kinase protein
VSGLAGLDLDRLRGWLDAEHPGLLEGPLDAALLTGGRSNLTYAISTPGRRLVLRRPPLGDLPKTAHDVAREFRIITALAPTTVPVPPGVALCTDAEVIGAPFYLMDFVDGRVLRSRADHSAYGAAEKADLADRLVDTLADIHEIDLVAAGLADLGRPDGYLERQVARWQRHLDVWGSNSLERLHALGARLAERRPQTTTTGLVHGDYRLDNLIVGDGLEILAVVDWEMATIGDTVADLGLLLVYWDLVGDVDNALSTAMGSDAGFPPGDALAQRYASRTGADLGALDWYVAFGAFKLAVVLEGVRQREAEHPVQQQASLDGLIPLLVDRAGERLDRR